MRTRLNGWQRLWIVGSVLWVIYVVLSALGPIFSLPQDLRTSSIWVEQLGIALVASVTVPAGGYAVGLDFRWIYRGFQSAARR